MHIHRDTELVFTAEFLFQAELKLTKKINARIYQTVT